MTYTLSAKSEARLAGVHPDLVRLVRRALQISDVDFAVVEGLRTLERQRELVAKGASQTMHSRHITGHAVDLAPVIGGSISWAWPPFYKLAAAMKQAAGEAGVPVVWGGTWKPVAELPEDVLRAVLSKSFADGPHFELSRLAYPK